MRPRRSRAVLSAVLGSKRKQLAAALLHGAYPLARIPAMARGRRSGAAGGVGHGGRRPATGIAALPAEPRHERSRTGSHGEQGQAARRSLRW